MDSIIEVDGKVSWEKRQTARAINNNLRSKFTTLETLQWKDLKWIFAFIFSSCSSFDHCLLRKLTGVNFLVANNTLWLATTCFIEAWHALIVRHISPQLLHHPSTLNHGSSVWWDEKWEMAEKFLNSILSCAMGCRDVMRKLRKIAISLPLLLHRWNLSRHRLECYEECSPGWRDFEQRSSKKKKKNRNFMSNRWSDPSQLCLNWILTIWELQRARVGC